MSSSSAPSRYPQLIVFAIVLPLALLILLSVLTHRSKRDLAVTRDAVRRLADTKLQTGMLLTEMLNNESGQRGYVVSQNPVFLEPYDLSLKEIPPLRQRLAAGVADEDARSLFSNLEQSIDARLAFSAHTVELQQAGSHEASVALIQTRRGKELMDQVRVDLGAVEHRLGQLIGIEEGKYTAVVKGNERISWCLVVADGIFVGVLISVLLRLRRAEQIVTVCAWSKTVRHEGEWISYDQYLTRKFGISITHGISPEEARKMREMIEGEVGSGIRKAG